MLSINNSLFLFVFATIVFATLWVDAQQVIHFNNGSSITLNNQYFTASFPYMQQNFTPQQQQQKGNGLASSGVYPWNFSLVQPSNFNGLCSSSFYAAQGSSCNEIAFGNPAAIAPTGDGNGIFFVFEIPRFRGSFYIMCDPTATTLTSPSNSYNIAERDTTFELTFVLTSAGACVNNKPVPPPPSPSSATTVYFNNGSKLVLFPRFFANDFPQYQQLGLAPNTYFWHVSLVQRSIFGGRCSSSPSFLATGENCGQLTFTDTAVSAAPNSDGSGVALTFVQQQNGQPWQVNVNVICNPNYLVLESLNGAYNASQTADGTLVLGMQFVSAGACLSTFSTAGKRENFHHRQSSKNIRSF